MPYGILFLFIIVFGTVYSLSARHWLPVWAGLEINLIAFIPLMLYRGTTQETESAVKYFIFQAVGSAIIILRRLLRFGTSFVWDFSSKSFPVFMEKGLFILVIGLFLKMGVFPFHFWFPGVAARSSWFTGLFLFTWQKIAPLFLFFSLSCLWRATFFILILFVAALSSIVGGVGGINQTQLRALLAYSSIAHIGWLVFCACLRERIIKIYLIIYFFITVCIFLIAWKAETNLVFQVFSSFFGKKAVFRLSMVFLLLSLGGIPPLLGFVPKWIVINFAVKIEMIFMLILLIVGALLRLFYYLRLTFSVLFLSGPFFLKENYLLEKWTLDGLCIFRIIFNSLGGVFLIKNFYFERLLYAMGLFYKP